jgi:hypothetical protein
MERHIWTFHTDVIAAIASFLLILHLLVSIGYGQDVVINEFMSSNQRAVADDEGKFPDWFELYNRAASPVSLSGWTITDHPTDTSRWQLPPVTLAPSEHILIWASGSTDFQPARFHETVIQPGDGCRYVIPTSEPDQSWTWPNIDDNSWTYARLSLGYGDGDDTTQIPQCGSVYVRMSFHIADSASIRYGLLHLDYDDGFVAYMNGVEIARRNIHGLPPTFDSLALDDHEAQMYEGGLPELFRIDNLPSLIHPGRNVLAIQLHNASSHSTDLSLIPFFTIGTESSPPNPRGMPAAIVGIAIPYHASFKLGGGSDTLLLKRDDGTTADSVFVRDMPSDISFGRAPDGSDVWKLFRPPTPGNPNSATGGNIATPRPRIDPPAGFFAGPVTVTLTNDSASAQIFYSLDGSPPNERDHLYTGPFQLDTSTVVRIMAQIPGELPSSDRVTSYIIGPPPTMPIASLSIHPLHLWDPETGIYVLGPNYDPNPPHRGANYWQDWERPVHIEFFEMDGSVGFEQDAGVKIHGGWTRYFPQKSLRLLARSKYGAGSINYRFFPNRDYTRWESILLRNGGSDWDHTMFRDALMTGLVADEDIDISAYRPSIVYINGAYWGIQNLREVMNEHYVAQRYDVDADSVDVMEIWGGPPMSGDREAYWAMQEFLSTHDLSDPTNYRQAREIIDIPKFITYSVTNIYVNNGDWPGNNNRFYRIKRPGAKWTWFLIDLDFGFGLHDTSGYRYNSLADALDPNGTSWPNPAYATFHLRKLCESPQFRYDFINGFADLINFRFRPDLVLRQLDEKKTALLPEIDRHLARWDRDHQEWDAKVEEERPFIQNRPEFMRQFVIDEFNLPGAATLTLESNPTAGGEIFINGRLAPTSPWSGVYFQGVPISLEARPASGYRFSGWTGGIAGMERRVVFGLPGDRTITALFTRDTGVHGIPVINEINYHSALDFDTGDWIEIYARDADVDLGDWSLTDADTTHRFRFPLGTVIPAGGFLVVAEDTARLDSLMPGLNRVIGNLGFGFSAAGDMIRILDHLDAVMDSVTYDDLPPWPIEADGGGSTLELIDPNVPNDRAQNWRASAQPHGSPSVSNRYNAPGRFRLLYPADGARVPLDSVRVVWSRSIDPDPADTVTYLLEWSRYPNFNLPLSIVVLDTFFTISQAPPATAGVDAEPDGLIDRQTIYWRVTARDASGTMTVSNQGSSGWSFNVFLILTPTEFRVHPVFPNPFNEQAWMRIDIPWQDDIEIRLFSLKGELLYSESGQQSLGVYNFRVPPDGMQNWESGIYFATVKYRGNTTTRKMVLLK